MFILHSWYMNTPHTYLTRLRTENYNISQYYDDLLPSNAQTLEFISIKMQAIPKLICLLAMPQILVFKFYSNQIGVQSRTTLLPTICWNCSSILYFTISIYSTVEQVTSNKTYPLVSITKLWKKTSNMLCHKLLLLGFSIPHWQ